MPLRFLHRSLPAAAALLLAASTATAAPPTEFTRDIQSDTWTATDALGRVLPGYAECGPPKPGRFVGVFYFVWMQKESDQGLYDNSKILAADPQRPKWGPLHAFHWWGEPRLGYYLSNDAAVIRRHAQMLSDAGVDVLICDVTNAFTYDETYLTLCRVFEEIRRTGRTTPQIAFIAHSRAGETVQKLYDRFYSKSLYADLWFRWKGRPLLLAPPAALTPALNSFFTVRDSWAWSNANGWFGDGRDKWPWLDNYPQRPGWHESPDKPEQISVTVAGHPSTHIGRSMHGGIQPGPADVTPALGLGFADQWRRAQEVDPEFVFVTGWNEWIAQRFESVPGDRQEFLGRRLNPGETFFVDEYNQEFSRDIEPMRGGHGDDYYYQLVANIRRYKGVRPQPKTSPSRTIRIAGDFRQWDDVTPVYRDDIADTTHRNHPGWGGHVYVNDTGRNDLERMKVARDSTNVYFYARTREPITVPNEHNWMTLLLDTDRSHATGWEGYDFAVRHAVIGGKTVIALCRNVGAVWHWTPITPVTMRVAGNEMQIAVPRSALGLPPNKGPLIFDFKWVDSVPDSGDILDFIDKGDVAPNGRFNYRYEE